MTSDLEMRRILPDIHPRVEALFEALAAAGEDRFFITAFMEREKELLAQGTRFVLPQPQLRVIE